MTTITIKEAMPSVDPRWTTGKQSFRSPAEEKTFYDKLRKAGRLATPEQIGRLREDAAFEEDDRIRDAHGIPRTKWPWQPEPTPAGRLLRDIQALTQDLKATDTARVPRSNCPLGQ